MYGPYTLPLHTSATLLQQLQQRGSYYCFQSTATDFGLLQKEHLCFVPGAYLLEIHLISVLCSEGFNRLWQACRGWQSTRPVIPPRLSLGGCLHSWVTGRQSSRYLLQNGVLRCKTPLYRKTQQRQPHCQTHPVSAQTKVFICQTNQDLCMQTGKSNAENSNNLENLAQMLEKWDSVRQLFTCSYKRAFNNCMLLIVSNPVRCLSFRCHLHC